MRTAIFATLLVAIILGAAGVFVHLLLRESLVRTMDQALFEVSNLAADLGLGDGSRETPENFLPWMRQGMVVARLDQEDQVIASWGPLPGNVKLVRSQGDVAGGQWRVWTQDLPDGRIVALGYMASVNESVARFDRSFLQIWPLAVFFAFILGYFGARRALAPLDRITRAAYSLAERREWWSVLPEPTSQDELWRLARAVNTLLMALGEVIESERRFTADAAHELRTPLTVLQGRIEQALERAEDPRVRAPLERAHRASLALLERVEKLLLLTRADSGQVPHPEPLDLSLLVAEAADELRPVVQDKGLWLEVNRPARAVTILGDRAMLSLALRNLLENAIKFSSSGTVRLSLEIDEQAATLAVEDQGPGVPPEALPHLFDRFYQARVEDRRQGSGLGLAIVAAVARWHAGVVGVENRSLGGARFWLRIPLANVASPSPAAELTS